MAETKPNLKRSEKQEDEAIAHSLAAALCKDDVESFLQLYDEIPNGVSPERLGNIKEMARQLAALARTPGYRHSPIQVKDSTYFGINHTLQATPLTLNGQLNTPDFSAFKTPPEGTPVDQKHFDYSEETLKTFVAHNLSLSFYEKQLNDPGITQQEYLDGKTVDNDGGERCGEENKTNNDDDAFEFHTPPEFQDDTNEGPPFGFPPSSDKLINSVINLLSKKSEADETENTGNCVNGKQDALDEELVKQNELFEMTEDEELDQDEKGFTKERSGSSISVDLEREFMEKDSLDGSPHSRKSFTQEEDDSGISLVDENDIVHELTITNGGHFETKKEYKFDDENERKNDDMYLSRSDSSTSQSQRTNTSSEKKIYNESELTYTKSYEVEDASTIGWQTRQKRMSRKRQEYERNSTTSYNDMNHTENRSRNSMTSYNDTETRSRNSTNSYNDMNSTESRSRNSTSSYNDTNSRSKESTPRRSAKNRNGKTDKSESSSKVGERHTDYKEKNAWTTKRGDDIELQDSPKRSGRRGGQPKRNSDGKWTKNGSREKHTDLGKHESLNAKLQYGVQPSVFSYRDALLKAGDKVPSAKDQVQNPVPSKADKMFNLESAVSYLSSVWTSVNNLHRKDPSKVYIYNGD